MGGILNGISDEWNPRTDPHISVNFGLADFEEGKAANKVALQRRLGLHEDPNVALVGFCARLCYQKGVHLVSAIIPWLMHDQGTGVNGRVQLVMMGKGDLKYATELAQAEADHRHRICGYVGFDPRIEHQMMAGCDFFLMPSQYEPCGLPQMYAQAYGTLPIVHETGGLKDSVRGLWDEARDRDVASGFVFAGFDENHLKERMYQALDVYNHRKDIFKQMQITALKCNNYWPKAVDEYEKHIDWTLESEPIK
jgi:starch synthase